MLIRSQNKETLVNFDGVLLLKVAEEERERQSSKRQTIYKIEIRTTGNITYNLGAYCDKEKAKSVFDQIQQKYLEVDTVRDYSSDNSSPTTTMERVFIMPKVFEMPKDE